MTHSPTVRVRRCVWGLLLATGLVHAQDGPTQQDLVRELRQLKLQVLQQGIELQSVKVGRLDRDLTELQRTEKYFDEQARELNQHLLNINHDVAVQTERPTDVESVRRAGYAFLENVQAITAADMGPD